MVPNVSPPPSHSFAANSPGVTANAGEALKHFGTAFVFLIAGLASLLLSSPTLARGGARLFQVVAGVHFITLGWLSLSVFGALQVFTGVALGGVQINGRWAPWGRWLWSTGLLLFVGGLLRNGLIMLGSGFLLLATGLIFYSIQIIPTLIKAQRGQVTRVFIALGLFSLWTAWGLGTLGGLARMGWAPAHEILPPGYLQAHILFAVFGWVGSMVIGVGSHLVPMFALSRNGSRLPLKLSLVFWTLLPVAGWLSAFHPSPWVQISWSVAAAGSLCWILQFVMYFRNRVRRERDHGLLITIVATAFMLISWLVARFVSDPVPFMALVVVGWLSLFTLGIYHRVLPFLVWFMKYSRPKKGLRPPRVKDLIDPGISLSVGVLFIVGVPTWIAGLWLRGIGALVVGTSCMLLGAFLTLGHLKTLRGGRPLSSVLIRHATPGGLVIKKGDPQ